VGNLAENRKTEPPGLGFMIEMQRGLDLGRGDPYLVGYTGFEVVGTCNWVMREGGSWLGPKASQQASIWPTKCSGPLFRAEGTWLGLGECS